MIPSRFAVATRMEDTFPDLDGVHPHPLLRLVQPLVLEALLADGTDVVDAGRVLRHGDILNLGLLGGGAVVVVAGFPGRSGGVGDGGIGVVVVPAVEVGAAGCRVDVVDVDCHGGFDPALVGDKLVRDYIHSNKKYEEKRGRHTSSSIKGLRYWPRFSYSAMR